MWAWKIGSHRRCPCPIRWQSIADNRSYRCNRADRRHRRCRWCPRARRAAGGQNRCAARQSGTGRGWLHFGRGGPGAGRSRSSSACPIRRRVSSGSLAICCEINEWNLSWHFNFPCWINQLNLWLRLRCGFSVSTWESLKSREIYGYWPYSMIRKKLINHVLVEKSKKPCRFSSHSSCIAVLFLIKHRKFVAIFF